MKNIYKYCIYFFITSVIFLGGLLFSNSFNDESCNNDLVFINEELKCSKSYAIEKHEYVKVKGDIVEYLEKEKGEGNLSRYSVYFRDLDNGPIFGINEKDRFIPASLLKLPLMLTYLKLADEGVIDLKEKVGFDLEDKTGLEQNFLPTVSVESGKSYTLEELIYIMIVYSDNTAYSVLIQYLRDLDSGRDYFLETFREIGIIDPTSNLEESIYTKAYGSIFRLLYNASYLSKESSEKALDMLSVTDFDRGITYKLPKTIKSAHKFGERFGMPNDEKELHDCGIIYFPGNPYLLCVMTEGKDFADLLRVIQNVSKMVYDEVDSRRIK